MEQGMLKCDFHAHSNDDPMDHIWHSSKDLIDEYARQGFDVVALTLHRKVHFPRELVAYAKSKGILLIPGVEARIREEAQDKHAKDVVILGISEQDHVRLVTVDDVRALRARYARQGKPLLVFAPHPFYPGKNALENVMVRNHDIFDAVEYCHFYTSIRNTYNERAKEFALTMGLPLVGTGDVHHLGQVGHTYTLIPASKGMGSIVDAIKGGKAQVKTKPLPLLAFAKTGAYLLFVSTQAPKRSSQKL